MICIELDNAKELMSHLFIKDTFDKFLCKEINIDTFVPFKIDGNLCRDFLTEVEKENLADVSYTPWQMLKPYCFNIIKGNKTPLSINVIFTLSPADIDAFALSKELSYNSNSITGLYINIRFSNKKLSVITGTSLNIFTLDKEVEHAWDDHVNHLINSLT